MPQKAQSGNVSVVGVFLAEILWHLSLWPFNLTPKFKPVSKSPVHIHTEDYFAVVVEGIGANHAPEAEAVPLPTGSYWFQRGEEAHVTEFAHDPQRIP